MNFSMFSIVILSTKMIRRQKFKKIFSGLPQNSGSPGFYLWLSGKVKWMNTLFLVEKIISVIVNVFGCFGCWVCLVAWELIWRFGKDQVWVADTKSALGWGGMIAVQGWALAVHCAFCSGLFCKEDGRVSGLRTVATRYFSAHFIATTREVISRWVRLSLNETHFPCESLYDICREMVQKFLFL